MTTPIILCATNRLARTLRSATPTNASTVWDTPQAFALEAWIDQLGEEAMLSGAVPALVLLDAFSEKLLWQQIINNGIDLDTAPLFDVAAMATKAADAYAMWRIWGLDDSQNAMSCEAQLFREWRASFQYTLLDQGWTVTVDRRLALVEALERGALHVRSRVVFAGFEDLNPLHLRLRAALDAQMLSPTAGTQAAALPAITAFEDIDAECQAVARWASTTLAAHPSWQIGIVAPDLGQVRDRLEYQLEHALHPELNSPTFAEHPRRYNFSLGRALTEVPVVACALALLDLASRVEQVEQPTLTALLLNPYWSDSVNEADARALVDAQMRRHLRHHVDVAQLVALARKRDAQAKLSCPAALRHLAQLLRHGTEIDATPRLPSEWAQIVRVLLRDAGWAGSSGNACRALSSHEYQAREAWSELLDRLACADALTDALSFSQVVAHLHTMSRERIFQPQTRGNPSVHVVGMLETAGLHFDALWIIGMHDGAWPPAPAPNPLIPGALQRAHSIPNSCAAVQLAYARTTLRRLQHQASVVQFSCPLMNGSQELRPSPLFALAGADATMVAQERSPARHWSEVLECLDDATGPVLGDAERVRGGVSLLRAQAICPAWAFYRFRLGAAALERTQAGLTAQERGTLVHDALESFWKQVNSRLALEQLAATPGTLDKRIQSAVSTSVETHETSLGAMAPAARELEVLRLTRLLREWLQAETRRSDFVVLECERELKHQIGPVALTLRVDRIDQQDGQLVVIDYRTGTLASINDWAAARITEPQLPIYALALASASPTQQIGALVFGKVRLGESRFVGLSAEDKFVDRVRGMHHVSGAPFAAFPNWNALQAHWDARIASIADEFGRGIAGVSVAAAKDLTYCEVLPLLRLPEREAWGAGLFTQPAGQSPHPSRQEF